MGFTLPALLNLDEEMSPGHAPDGVAPFLSRHQAPIGYNMGIDTHMLSANAACGMDGRYTIRVTSASEMSGLPSIAT